jgi:hypothetical protein
MTAVASYRDADAAPASEAPPRRSVLRRVEWILDESPVSRSGRAMRIRWVIGSLFLAYGVLLEVVNAVRGTIAFVPFVFVVLALPILFNRLGRLGRYFLPVCLGLFAYGTAGSYVDKYKLTVHYAFQIRADRLLGGGTVPAVWLQQHLYDGHTRVLEAVCVGFYGGHFFIPLLLGLALALRNRSADFRFLMFGILTVSVFGAFTFLLMPTAPPWLAVREGHLTGVHEILKLGLRDLHLSALAAVEGDPTKYDVTAAVPSLHTAYPLICLVTAFRARLPRPVVGALALNLLGVVFAIVYMGEHYVFDVIAGAAYASVALFVVHLAFRTRRRSPAPAVALAGR